MREQVLIDMSKISIKKLKTYEYIDKITIKEHKTNVEIFFQSSPFEFSVNNLTIDQSKTINNFQRSISGVQIDKDKFYYLTS